MKADELLRLRLANQHLDTPRLNDPAQLVAHLGAVQAQDFPAAKWGLGVRLRGVSDAQVEHAFAEGRILRTHVMRPTWHFVAPADIRWMLALTADRVKQAMGTYLRSAGVDDAFMARAEAVLIRALEGGRSLTRPELGAALREGGLDVANAWILGQVTWRAEVDGVLVSGPPRGRQQTHALFEERVPPAPALSRDEALAELTWRYFNSHGPALVADCSWWSGLTVSDVRRGLESNQGRLQCERVDDREYWFASNPARPIEAAVHLLPNYDEFTVAYRHRDLFFDSKLNRSGNPREDVPFADVMLASGHVVGNWQRRTMETRWWIEPSDVMERELPTAVNRYASFRSGRQ
jgi:winged helix DNA-binding protein